MTTGGPLSVIRTFLLAWHFLTAIPLNRRHHDPEPGELARSMIWYPLIGLILGGLLAASDVVLSLILPLHVVNVVLIVILVALTRGLHQDGLADTLDGLAGGRTPAKRLAIMRDPRIGAIGATGLFLALGLRYAGLQALPSERLTMLLCMPAVGRWAMVIGSFSAPYARAEGGLAQEFIRHLSFSSVLVATILLAGALLGLLGPLGAAVVLCSGGVAARTMTAVSVRWFGGITGDTLGATNEIVEIVWLLAGPALLGLR